MATTTKAHIAAVDDREVSPAAASGTAAFNKWVDTSTLAADIKAGRIIQGVDPVANTLASTPYRQYIKRVIKRSGLTDAQVTRQLASNICGYVAALPFVPSPDEIVNTQTGETEFDVQVKALAAAAEGQVRSSTGAVATMIGPARALVKAALELRVQDPDGSKGIAWVNDPLPAERPGGEGSRFDDEGVPQGLDASQRERMAEFVGEEEPDEVAEVEED